MEADSKKIATMNKFHDTINSNAPFGQGRKEAPGLNEIPRMTQWESRRLDDQHLALVKEQRK